MKIHCEPSSINLRNEPLPFLVEFFMVQGPGFRCVAYRDAEGRWRNALNNEELFGDIQVLE